ncbi:hypothetical protein CPB85DRAFT_1443547 [Mucidula mucida]|nr:hypothetical protein CPB85DRAFT_1443547 [Mucidula mucida]
MGVCKYFASVARPIIWSSAPFCVSAMMTTNFVTSVALKTKLEEDGFGEIVEAALARMPVEGLTITDALITKRVLKLVEVVAPRLKVLKIAASCHASGEVSDDELKAVFGAMQGLEELNITGRSSQCRLMRSPCIIPISNLRRLYTDALFTIDSCIAHHAALEHLEIYAMQVSWHDTRFLYNRLQAFPHAHPDPRRDRYSLWADLPFHSLVSFKAPPGLLPKFFSLGPKLQVLDSRGTNSEEDSSHPFLDPTLGPRIYGSWLFSILRVMRVIYTGTADHDSDQYTVPKMFEERETRFSVEELLITFDDAYFTLEVGRSKRDCSWCIWRRSSR